MSDRQISFPFSFEGTGGVGDTTDLTKQVQDHVVSVVGTQQGERVMLPTYGTNIMPYVFSAMTDMTELDIRQAIATAVQRDAPEVLLTSVDFDPDPTNGQLNLVVNYALSTSQGETQSATIPIALTS